MVAAHKAAAQTERVGQEASINGKAFMKEADFRSSLKKDIIITHKLCDLGEVTQPF